MNIALSLPRVLPLSFLPARSRATDQTQAAQPVLLRLVKNATLTLANQHQQLRVLSGCVWITRDGCPADTVLEAGEIFEQQPGAPVLVQALESVELLIAG